MLVYKIFKKTFSVKYLTKAKVELDFLSVKTSIFFLDYWSALF